MTLFPFEATCSTNIDRMVEDIYDYIKSLIEKHCPKRTQHRQLVPPWFSRETFHTMKLLSTTRRAQRKKPNSLVLSEKILRLENMLLELVEEERCQYQQKLVTTRDTTVIFKHLKSLRKTVTQPQILSLEEETADSTQQKVVLLNRYFQSIFSETNEDTVADDLPDPTLMNFDFSSKRIRAILTNIDVSKTRGPDNIPACFLKHLAESLSLFLSAAFRNIKRLGKIPNCWKIGAVSPIQKKGCRASVKNYRPVTLLSIVSNVLKRCMYGPIEKQFSDHLTTSQNGFVKKRSIVSNMLCFVTTFKLRWKETQIRCTPYTPTSQKLLIRSRMLNC